MMLLFAKIVYDLAINYFSENVPSYMFDRLLNTPLDHIINLQIAHLGSFQTNGAFWQNYLTAFSRYNKSPL